MLPGGPLVGRTIAEVGLRSMKYAFVLDISAWRRLLTVVGPDEVSRPTTASRSWASSMPSNELRRIPGISVAEDQTFQLDLQHAQRWLVESCYPRGLR